MWQHWTLVAIGGAIGSTMRYAVSRLLPMESPASWPWATFAVNVVGCLLIGVALGILARPIGDALAMPSDVTSASPTAAREAWRLFLVTGILGGFTTFSAFGFETLRMIQAGSIALAIAYVLASVLAGVLAVGVGWAIAR